MEEKKVKKKKAGARAKVLHSQVALVVKNLPADTYRYKWHRLGPRSGDSPEGGPLQYSCLENPMDRGACWATVHGISKGRAWLKWLSMHAGIPCTSEGVDLRGSRNTWFVVIGAESMVTDGERMLLKVGSIHIGFWLLPFWWDTEKLMTAVHLPKLEHSISLCKINLKTSTFSLGLPSKLS